MNWLTLLQYVPLLISAIPKIQAAYNTTTTGTTAKVGSVIEALAPQLAPIFESIGSQMFPALAPALHVAAGAIAGFHPDATKWVQDALNRLDNAGLAVDGHFGPRTLAAIKNFQAKNGLAVNGFIDDAESALITQLLTRLG